MVDPVQGDNDTHIKRRRWPYVVFGLAVLAALYLAIFRLPEPRLTLDYLKALTWPGLVAVVLYWLREPLREKVAQLLKIGALGVEAQFANLRLQEELTGPAAAVLDDTEDSGSEDPEATPGEAAGVVHKVNIDDHLKVTDQSKSDGVGEPESTPPVRGLPTVQQVAAQMAVLERGLKRGKEKQAIEDIMRVSAWWGYDMASLGFKTRPTPVVEWTEDGRPLIQYAKGEPGGAANIPVQRGGAEGNRQVMVSRLEQEIRDLEAKVERPMTILDYAVGPLGEPDGKREGDKGRLRKLKLRLRKIDPDSPLGLE